MINWPGLLELLEEEGVGSVPTDGVRYWLARLGGDFQARLAGLATGAMQGLLVPLLGRPCGPARGCPVFGRVPARCTGSLAPMHLLG